MQSVMARYASEVQAARFATAEVGGEFDPQWLSGRPAGSTVPSVV